MEITSKILVLGGRGLAGSALIRRLQASGYANILHPTSAELNLTRQKDVEEYFTREAPEYVFLAAGRVGGIGANATYPAEFIYENLMMEANVIHTAWQSAVKKLLFLGSSCIYPKFAAQPMKEACLLTGELEPTNEPYAVAKIAGIKMCQAYFRQHGARFISCMPTNLYGPGDNYHLENSHVLPALIRKVHEAKEMKEKSVVLWGTGAARREFLYVDDLADACLGLMLNYEQEKTINVGSGEEVTIRQLAETICEVIGYEGDLVFDATKPDGTARKLLDSSRLYAMGWRPRVNLRQGTLLAYEDFLAGNTRL